MKTLAARGKSQGWLAKRSGMTVPAINKILSGRRCPTEISVLRIAGGFECNDSEIKQFRILDEIGNELQALLRAVREHRLPAATISDETRIGLRTIQRILGGDLPASDEELRRIYLAVTVRDERRGNINDFLEAAGDYILGPTCNLPTNRS